MCWTKIAVEQYFQHWRKNGFDVELSPFMDLKMWKILYEKGRFFEKAMGTIKGQIRRVRDLFRIHHYDGIYLHMSVTPLGTSLFERLYLWLEKYTIYDVEDNIFVEKSYGRNRLAKLLKGAPKTKVLVRNADHVITSSPFLNDYCMGINKKNSAPSLVRQ